MNIINTTKHFTPKELVVLGGATILTVYNLIQFYRERKQLRGFNAPPHVAYSLPIFGHSLYLLYDNIRFTDWCIKTYGDIYDLDVFGKTMTVTSGVVAQQVFKVEEDQLSGIEGALKDALFLHYSLTEKDFEMMLTAFPSITKRTMSPPKVLEFTDMILQGYERGVKDLFGDREQIVMDKPMHYFQRLVAHMSITCFVGPEVIGNKTVLESFAAFTDDLMRNIPLYMTLPKFLHPLLRRCNQQQSSVAYHRSVMVQHIEPIVRARRQIGGQRIPSSPNLLQSLIDFRKLDGTQYTIEELGQSALILAFASVFTTAINLMHCINWLLVRPDLREKLEQEIEAIIGRDGRPVTVDNVQKMVFLDRFLLEVLRQGGDVLGGGRKVMTDPCFTFSNGYQIPKGRIVLTTDRQLNFGSNEVRSQVHEMEPNLSEPKTAAQASRNIANFGGGRHRCPGRYFAIHEIKLALVSLLRDYKVELVAGKAPTPYKYLGGMRVFVTQQPIVLTKKTSSSSRMEI